MDPDGTCDSRWARKEDRTIERRFMGFRWVLLTCSRGKRHRRKLRQQVRGVSEDVDNIDLLCVSSRIDSIWV